MQDHFQKMMAAIRVKDPSNEDLTSQGKTKYQIRIYEGRLRYLHSKMKYHNGPRHELLLMKHDFDETLRKLLDYKGVKTQQ
jgi:hypothetical protein